MTLSEFIRTYQTFSNSELIEIIDHPGNYQPLAVQAAAQVLSAGNVSREVVQSAGQKDFSRPKLL